jgi:hypothetical protein
MTCKWDCSISKVYCEAIYYPEPETPKAEQIPQVQPMEEVEFKPKPTSPVYRQQFLGRDYRAARRLDN